MADQKKKIFVVDDDKMFCNILADHLEDQIVYSVETFGTGEECLEQLHRQPDAIILDYYLDSKVPGAKNGLEILQIIHKTDPGLKVIMLSSQEHYGVALQTIASGAVYYVIKDLKSFQEIDSILEEL
ncbi:MAG: response regulator [Saprospiraceae bacterium]|nr:response regulator [Saprospiraceae bacterium]